MVPIGIVAGASHWNPTAVFTINFFAIIPLAAVLSFATEEISVKLGETMGGLLNATFGNAVELIVRSLVTRRMHQRLLIVYRSALLRSGRVRYRSYSPRCWAPSCRTFCSLWACASFFGGLVHRGQNGAGTEQIFSAAVAQTTCSLMTLSSASLVIPAAVSNAPVPRQTFADPTQLYAVLSQNGSDDKQQSILVLSRGTAIILLLLYVLYLFFQLRTHSNLFDAEGQTVDEDEQEEPHMGAISAAAVLVVVTVLVAICADYLVGAIDPLVETAHISKAFIGLILIPIVGNAAEHVTAVVVALRDKMDLAMGVAIGSSIQIALGVTPFLVIVGWIIGQPMTLHFETCKLAPICRAMQV